MTMQDFDFADLLETDPTLRRAIFESFLPANANPFQQNAFGSLLQPTFNRFLAQIGSQIRNDQAPAQTFTSFLEGQFDPVRELLRLPARPGASVSGPTIFRF